MSSPEPSAPDGLTPALELAVDDALTLLSRGDITIEGRVMSASNATFYCRVEVDGVAAACVYKPVQGERPLWDFPDGTLAEREVAAFAISQAAEWHIVPPTVLRDGPFGEGMVQLWVEHDDTIDLIERINAGTDPGLQSVAAFDAVINNSDRKVSHLLPRRAPGAGYLGVDHGVSFGIEHKLRTVLWQWAGDPIPDEQRLPLRKLAAGLESDGDLAETLAELLTTKEVRATRDRVVRLISKGRFPLPPKDWPAIPYPPY